MGRIISLTKECNHSNCREVCHVKSYAKPKVSLKRTALKRGVFKPKEYADDINVWFETIRVSLKGVCSHCGGKSCKNDDKYFKFSICHILPKAYFPSVSTNLDNWVELCFWQNNCHDNMDSNMLDLIDMNCFNEIVEKFCKMYPAIAPAERRRIPAILMQYVEVEL